MNTALAGKRYKNIFLNVTIRLIN